MNTLQRHTPRFSVVGPEVALSDMLRDTSSATDRYILGLTPYIDLTPDYQRWLDARWQESAPIFGQQEAVDYAFEQIAAGKLVLKSETFEDVHTEKFVQVRELTRKYNGKETVLRMNHVAHLLDVHRVLALGKSVVDFRTTERVGMPSDPDYSEYGRFAVTTFDDATTATELFEQIEQAARAPRVLNGLGQSPR